jgi:ketosteroid isomerase-like protein
MKKCMLILWLFPATLVWSQSDDGKVAAVVERLNNALVAADSATLVAITSEDLTYGHSSGKVEGKNAFIDAVLNGPFKFQSISTADQTVTFTKRTAIVRHTFTGKATSNGAPADVKLSVLQVWQKQGRNWKLLARQAVKL